VKHDRILRVPPGAADVSRRGAAMEGAGRVFLASVPNSTGIRGRVVVIGGGMAGATVAKYLRAWGGTGVAVTLIERDAAYTSNVMSNRVLSGERTLHSLQCTYAALASRYGVKIVRGDVVAIDPIARAVTLASGSRLAYDRLVIAPGVDFDALPGLESAAARARVPHAWKTGPQTTALRAMITAMSPGGVFVLGIPAGAWRYPAAAYERACIVADWLERHRPGSKVVVLDANPGIAAEVPMFGEAIREGRRPVVEYHAGVSISRVDATTMTVHTDIGEIRGDVLNLIPPQRAGKVVAANGLADVDGRWTRVDARSHEASGVPGIHVIGDAAAASRPKSGQVAHQAAKDCADAVLRLLAGRALAPQPCAIVPITSGNRSRLAETPANDGLVEAMQRVAAASAMLSPPLAGNMRFNSLMRESFA
jgi:sulfide dehydrogenase [flavocytochrome c] flavoprotein chain